jgi:hypothetical protein
MMRNKTLLLLATVGLGLSHTSVMSQELPAPTQQCRATESGAVEQKGNQPPTAWMPPPPHAPDGAPEMMGSPRPDNGLGLAGALSSVETLVGIRSNQLDVWRDYSSAVIAFLQQPMPDSMQHRAPPEFGARKDAGPMMDVLADAAIAHGNAALRVKVTLEALKKILTPEQTKLLASAEDELMRGAMGEVPSEQGPPHIHNRFDPMFEGHQPRP